MSYSDTSFVVDTGGGYTYLNNKQYYDQAASQLAAHAAWEFVESVNYVNGANTQTRYVWRCKSAVSGLIKDFYVIFSVQFTTATGVWTTNNGVRILLAEDYNATTHVASRQAIISSNGTSVTLNADGTHPQTWNLTQDINTTIGTMQGYINFCGSNSNATSLRLLLLVTNDCITGMYRDLTNNVGVQQFYVGAFDSVMNSTDEPLPLLLAQGGGGAIGNQSAAGNNGSGWTTRHPKCGGLTGNGFFNVTWGVDWSRNGQYIGSYAVHMWAAAQTSGGGSGTLGNTGDPKVNLFLNGQVPVSRCAITMWNTWGAGSGATRGALRGYPKYWYEQNCSSHTFGDTFLVNGVAMAGGGFTSQGGILDTSQ